MKWVGLLMLALAIGLATVAPGSVWGDEGGRGGTSGNPMPETMGGWMGGMMHGTPMGARSEGFGRERPLLSLALRHRAELELSDDQVRTLEALIERFRKEAETRLRAIEAAERDLAALFESEEWNLGEVEAKVRAIEKLRADLRLARIRTIAEGRAALTPEQRKKLEGIIAAGRRPPATRRSEAPEGERSRGVEEMHRFMSSARMPQAMAGMMEMARRMGDGDPMLGMVRMMEMMGAMGGADGHPRGTRGPGGVRREPAASPAAC